MVKICILSTIVNNEWVNDFLSQVVNLCKVNNAIAILSTSQREVFNMINNVKKNFNDVKILSILYDKKLPNWYNVPDRVWDIVYGRNLVRREALSIGCDFQFWIDSDVFIELDLPKRMIDLMNRYGIDVLFHLIPFQNHIALFSSALVTFNKLASSRLFFGCYQDTVNENNLAVEDDILMFKAGVLGLKVATCSISNVKHKNWYYRKRNELIFLDPKVKIIRIVKV